LKGDLIILKAKRMLELSGVKNEDFPSFSNGWLEKFQKRHGFKSFKSYGESGSVNLDVVSTARNVLKEVTSRYSPKDIFNMDETGLFYTMAPDRTIARKKAEGIKQDKTRLTLALSCNADGSELLNPFFIGHANKPRCFSKKSGQDLGFFYRSNKKAWMTSLLFQEWIKNFDGQMVSQKRKVLLLLDNAPSHIVDETELSSGEVHMLPPNTTSKLQPMDAGIIAAFKRKYRHRHMSNAVDRFENGQTDIYKVDQLSAMKWSIEDWYDISSQSICNCWRQVDILQTLPASVTEQGSSENELNELNELISRLKIANPLSAEDFISKYEILQEKKIADEDLFSDENLREQLECVEELDTPEELDDYVAPKPSYTTSEKLEILSMAIDILRDSDLFNPVNDSKIMNRLFKEKSHLRNLSVQQIKQSKLTDFFLKGTTEKAGGKDWGV
jgi:hypothetical protein